MIKLGGLVTLKPIQEAESDRYTHIGYGKYKEKGKEDDKDAPTFKKDGDKYVPTKGDMAAKGGDSSAGEEKPKVNIFNKDKEEPKKDTSSDSSEPDYDKYTNKSQTMTDFFKGGLSIDGLKKVADKNFGSEIATERDLDGFLNNKFMQDVMSDEHGVDKDTLISKVKDLKTALFGGDKEEPKSEPAKDSTGDRAGNPAVNTAVRKKAQKMGITPAKLGKEEYQKKMAQAAVAALTDANFHSEARQLVADLEGKPELAEKPDYPDVTDPEFNEKMKVINDKYNSVYSEPDDDAEDLGISAANEASWDGQDALDSIAFDLKMNGFKALAAKLQSVIKESKSTRLKDLLPEGFVVMYKMKKDLKNMNIGPAQAKYDDKSEAEKFLKSVEKDGGKGMIVSDKAPKSKIDRGI
jgi:hypothetical protein